MSSSPADDRFDALSRAIERAARESSDVSELEPMLTELLALLQSGEVDRGVAVAEFTRLAHEWPWGAVEVLEFTMHRLKWPEVRLALEGYREDGDNFRFRTLASHVLAAYEDEWQEGEIYAAYRTS